MAVNTPPYVIQAGSHSAQLFRQAISTLMNSQGGVVNSGDYLITAQATPNMTVNMAGGVPGGQAWVPGSSATYQGNYYVYNDATVVQTIAAASASNPRIDISIIQILDAAYTGSSSLSQAAIVTGTAAASPVQPTTPTSSLLLAAIAVAANATTITTSNITDKRVFAQSNVYPLYNAWNFATLGPLVNNAGPTTIGTVGTITVVQTTRVRFWTKWDCSLLTTTQGQALTIALTCNGAGMDVGGTSQIEWGSSTIQPIQQITAIGTKILAAGTYTVSANYTVGGGGPNVSVANAYFEVQAVAV